MIFFFWLVHITNFQKKNNTCQVIVFTSLNLHNTKNQLKMIHLHDKTFEPFITSKEIKFAIKNMAKQMDDDFFNEVPIFIGVLNGAFMVMGDLMKQYRGMCEVSFVKMASYEGTESTNEVKQLIGLNQNLEGRTENSVKNRFYSTVRKLLSDMEKKGKYVN